MEGVILMRRDEQTQTVLKGVQKKTEELNGSILPKDVKSGRSTIAANW